MEFFEVIQRRRSARSFLDTPVEWDALRRIFEAARRAPSAGNLQAYRIFVVKEAWGLKLLARAVGDQPYVSGAPVVLVFCADPERAAKRYGARGEQLFCIQDATIACAYAQLAATALGLASVWVGEVLEPEVVRMALSGTTSLWPIALLPIGYPAEEPDRRPRLDLADLIEGLSPEEFDALRRGAS